MQHIKSINKGFRVNDILRVLSYVTPFWQFKVMLALIVVTTVLDVLTPSVIGRTIDIIELTSTGKTIENNGSFADILLMPIANWLASSGYNKNFSVFMVFVGSIIGIAIALGVLNYVGRYITAWTSQRASYNIRSDLYNSLLEQSFSFYDKQRTGQLMARATGDIGLIERFFDFGIRMIVSTVILLPMVLYLLFKTNVILSLLTLVILPIIFVTVWNFSQKVSPMWLKIREQYGDITSVIQESLMGIRVVRGFAQEQQETKKLERVSGEYFDTNITVTKLRAFYMPLATLISSLGFVLIIWYGGNQVISGTMSLGSLIAFYFYVVRISQPVRMLGQISAMTIRATAATGRVFEIVDAEIIVKDKPNSIELRDPKGHVEIKNVSFSYDQKNLVLNKINLDVKPGQTVAILGATGSGKSSIINLIPRFYDVTDGQICIDGIDVRDIKIKSLRQHVGIVRQDPFLFSTNFHENIAYGVEKARQEDIEEAAKKAKIHEYIMSLPEKYNTRIGERGVTVSGGQKQRIAIARALLKNPKILILDDSTSSVDTQTEHEIQESLNELLQNRTTFIITQRLSSIKKASYIVVLEDGAIVEEGSHDKLMTIKGVYKKLYDTQVAEATEKEVVY